MPSTDIKDYYRRSWGIGDRQPFGSGGEVSFDTSAELAKAGPDKGLWKIRLGEPGSGKTERITYKGTEQEIKEKIKKHNKAVKEAKIKKFTLDFEDFIKNYKWTDFVTDLKKGMTLGDITEKLIEIDPEFYEAKPKFTYKTGPKKGTLLTAKEDLRNFLSQKLDRTDNKELRIIEKQNQKKTKVIQKKGITAAKKWIADNGPRFKKEGHLGYFRKAFFDFMKANYPTLVKTAGTGTKEVIAGTQYINESAKAFGQTGAGIQKNIGAINNALKTALGIPLHTNVAKSAAEKTKNWQKYYKVIEELLPTAQKNGVVDTHFTHARTGKPVKITSKNYMTWLKSSQTDVMKKIFNDLVKFSVEHTGGMKRAKQLMDSDALGQIIAQEHGEFLDKKGRKITANLLKGKLYDKTNRFEY